MIKGFSCMMSAITAVGNLRGPSIIYILNEFFQDCCAFRIVRKYFSNPLRQVRLLTKVLAKPMPCPSEEISTSINCRSNKFSVRLLEKSSSVLHCSSGQRIPQRLGSTPLGARDLATVRPCYGSPLPLSPPSPATGCLPSGAVAK